MHYPEPIARLMDSFMKLPGIGAKTAARLAFFCMDMREEDVLNFANSLISCKRDLAICVPFVKCDARRSVRNLCGYYA